MSIAVLKYVRCHGHRIHLATTVPASLPLGFLVPKVAPAYPHHCGTGLCSPPFLSESASVAIVSNPVVSSLQLGCFRLDINPAKCLAFAIAYTAVGPRGGGTDAVACDSSIVVLRTNRRRLLWTAGPVARSVNPSPFVTTDPARRRSIELLVWLLHESKLSFVLCIGFTTPLAAETWRFCTFVLAGVAITQCFTLALVLAAGTGA